LRCAVVSPQRETRVAPWTLRKTFSWFEQGCLKRCQHQWSFWQSLRKWTSLQAENRSPCRSWLEHGKQRSQGRRENGSELNSLEKGKRATGNCFP
jgi:hypothetical protein